MEVAWSITMWHPAGGDGHARRLREIQQVEAQIAAVSSERAALSDATQVRNAFIFQASYAILSACGHHECCHKPCCSPRQSLLCSQRTVAALLASLRTVLQLEKRQPARLSCSKSCPTCKYAERRGDGGVHKAAAAAHGRAAGGGGAAD